MENQITVGIPTKNRYDSLKNTLLSIACQTIQLPLIEVIIVDDSDNPIDIRNLPGFPQVLELLNQKNITWKVLFGARKGQHISHQLIQEQAQGNLIFRIDDDCIAEPNVISSLNSLLKEGVGAVAPLVLLPNPQVLPESLKGLTNTIHNLNLPNIQWFRHFTFETKHQFQEVDHLYSCFLYRKGIVNYEKNLSPVSHREETMFTYSLKLAGYKLIVDKEVTVWHFREESGGIRSGTFPFMWEHDEGVFKKFLSTHKIEQEDTKMIVLDCGLGDHYCFKHILKDLKKKNKNITIAACYPEVFFDDKGIKLISIAEAKLLMNIEEFNIYKKMIDWNWKKSELEAFKKLYL